MPKGWPSSVESLSDVQQALATARPGDGHLRPDGLTVGGVFVCFGRGGAGPGSVGDVGWAGAVAVRAGTVLEATSVTGTAGAPYLRGYLALREGRILEQAVRRLRVPPDVLLVNATGLDHPRRAGLAVHLGAVLEVPTVGVTHRPLLAVGDWPRSRELGVSSPLAIGGEIVGYWLRTKADCRPLAVHAGWSTSPEEARSVVQSVVLDNRTPEPLREARRLARTARGLVAREKG